MLLRISRIVTGFEGDARFCWLSVDSIIINEGVDRNVKTVMFKYLKINTVIQQRATKLMYKKKI